MDIYNEVANLTGLSRDTVKARCFPLFYTTIELPKETNKLIEYLVKYLKG